MDKRQLIWGACGYLLTAGTQPLLAHSHSHTYIVEETPPSVVVIQQAPAPVVNVITVESQPPADLVEEVEPCPGKEYVWQKGHWQWNGSWVWVRGNWGRRPHPEGVFIPGYWKQSHHRWEWVEPYWK